jgi:putative peptidoglycan lipid II flippase
LLARRGGWAAGQLALTQVMLVTVLVLANGTAGGVVVWTFALTFFLLPYSLFAVPVATTLYPGLARAYQADDLARFGASLGRGIRVTTVLLVGSAAALAALSWPVVRVAAFGAARTGGVASLAHALMAFAGGLLGYGLLYLLTRASYAMGDARAPMLAMAAVAAVGLAAMVVATAVVPDAERAAALGGAFAGAHLIGAVLLGAHVLRRLPPAVRPRLGASIVRTLAAGAVACVAMAVVAGGLDGHGRVAAFGTLVVGAAVGVAVYAGAQRALTGQQVRELVALDGPVVGG